MGVDSEEGVGSHFWFLAELAIADSKPVAEKRSLKQRRLARLPDDQRRDVRKSKILVADDYNLNQAFIKKLLSRMGVENVDIVDNGKGAVDALKNGSYAMILMDCHMPVMSGFDATQEIRAQEATAGNDRIPILAMTADATAGARERCLRAGMDDYISKPLDPDELKEIMGRWLTFPSEENAATPAPVPAAAPTTHPVIAVLKDYADTDEELRELVGAFVTGAREVVAILQKNCADGENRDWVEAAHKLKGSAAMIRAEDLRSLCERAEGMTTATAADRKAMHGQIGSAVTKVTDGLVDFMPQRLCRSVVIQFISIYCIRSGG